MAPRRTARALARPTHSCPRAVDALGIEAVPVGHDAVGRLAALRVRTGLRFPDCCVVLATEDVAATALATFDRRLATAAREHGLRLL